MTQILALWASHPPLMSPRAALAADDLPQQGVAEAREAQDDQDGAGAGGP